MKDNILVIFYIDKNLMEKMINEYYKLYCYDIYGPNANKKKQLCIKI